MIIEDFGAMESREIIEWFSKFVDELPKHMADDGKIDFKEYMEASANTAPALLKAIWKSWKAPGELRNIAPAEAKILLAMLMKAILKMAQVYMPVAPVKVAVEEKAEEVKEAVLDKLEEAVG